MNLKPWTEDKDSEIYENEEADDTPIYIFTEILDLDLHFDLY